MPMSSRWSLWILIAQGCFSDTHGREKGAMSLRGERLAQQRLADRELLKKLNSEYISENEKEDAEIAAAKRAADRKEAAEAAAAKQAVAAAPISTKGHGANSAKARGANFAMHGKGRGTRGRGAKGRGAKGRGAKGRGAKEKVIQNKLRAMNKRPPPLSGTVVKDPYTVKSATHIVKPPGLGSLLSRKNPLSVRS